MLLLQSSNAAIQLSDSNKITCASTFLADTAAVWWYTLVQSNNKPNNWENFEQEITCEFIPEGHRKRVRQKPRRCKQVGSVSNYIGEFRNIVLAVQNIEKGQLFDRFFDGLKPTVHMEVMKSTVERFEDAAKTALRVDSSVWHNRSPVQESTSTGLAPIRWSLEICKEARESPWRLQKVGRRRLS